MDNSILNSLIREKTYVVGIFKDDEDMMDALKGLKEKDYVAKDAYLPFPVHGIDKVLNMRESYIGYVAFAFGLLGTILALWMQIYMMQDWELNIGGKPVLSWPAFVPITFEVTILLAALGMAAVYFARSHLFPGFEPKLFDSRQTNDRFVVIYEVDEGKREAVKDELQSYNIAEVREETVNESKIGFPLPFKY